MAIPFPSKLSSQAAAFRRRLHAWYRGHHRRLPWRAVPSPYRTVVSEFMLQQTQVATVLPYFDRWMRALPGFGALAAAPEAAVLKLWEGLGYYSRARSLHRLARALAARPALPTTPEGWAGLPGIGPYTAAAISSIAFGARAACVDGNVVRILSRLTADGTAFRDGAAAARHFAPLAAALLPASDPGTHNQAMMELGALVCRRQPECSACPVRRFCAAAGEGSPERYPRLERRKTVERAVTRIWCEKSGRLLLHRNPSGARRLAALYELPTAGQAGLAEPLPAEMPLLVRKRRSITCHRIVESIHAVPAGALRLSGDGASAPFRWIPRAGLSRIALSGPHRRWISELIERRRLSD